MRIKGVLLREGGCEDWEKAKALIWRVFETCNASDYSQEGIRQFRDFLDDDTLYRMFLAGSFRLVVASLYGNLVGVLGLRDLCHLSLLFVETTCHRNGIGSALVEYAAEMIARESGGTRLTVYATPYASDFYLRLGFVSTDQVKQDGGIIYTPMALRLE